MSLRKLLLPAIAVLVIPSGSALAQQVAAPGASSQDAKPEVSVVVTGGSFIGIYTEEVNRENMSKYGLAEARGVVISKVMDDSPAARAGLRKDDVILRFNGEEVTSVRRLSRMIAEVSPDHVARLTISRGGAEQEVSVTVGKRDDFNTRILQSYSLLGDNQKMLEELQQGRNGFAYSLGSHRRIGVATTPLTKQLADYFGVTSGKGLLLTSVKENSPAAKAGLKAGDIITAVNGEPVEDAGDLIEAVNRNQTGDVTLTIVRDKSQRTVTVTPDKGQTMFSPDFPYEAFPRVGQFVMPRTDVTPMINKALLQRIEVKPRIKINPSFRWIWGMQPL